MECLDNFFCCCDSRCRYIYAVCGDPRNTYPGIQKEDSRSRDNTGGSFGRCYTDLIEHGYVTGKPYLGLVSTNVSGEAQRYGTPAGAYVLGVVEGSCSANAGVQTGDIITAFNGEAITSADELTNAGSACKAGDEVTLTIVRSGQTVTATLTLEERDAAREQAIQELYDQIQQEQYEQYQQQQQQSGWGYGFPFGW